MQIFFLPGKGGSDGRVWLHLIFFRSPVFEAMLKNDMEEKQKKEIPIPDSTPEIVKPMISYIYTGNVPENIKQIAPELIQVSDKYQLEILAEACAEALVEELTDENAMKTLVLIDRYAPSPGNRNKVLDFICANARRIMKCADWKEFKKAYPDLVSNILEVLAEKYEQANAKIAKMDKDPEESE